MSHGIWIAAVVFLLGLEVCGADGTAPARPKVLPWNGHKAAVSLTYDDGDAAHLDIAIPEMDKRGIKGTFYLIASRFGAAPGDRIDEWKKAFDSGHELCNHSMNHVWPQGFNADQLKVEVDGAKAKLEQLFGQRIETFAYPFVAITPELRKQLGDAYVAARGGSNRLQPLQRDVDWANIPSMVTLTRTTADEYHEWIGRTLDQGAWCVFMIHGIEGKGHGWEPMPVKLYTGLLDDLAQKRDEIWIATFAEVVSYFRAQNAFEWSTIVSVRDAVNFTWETPAAIPKGVVLKVVFEAPVGKVTQRNKELTADAKGVYSVSFDAGAVTITSR